ncbi:hypothetical protein [Caulobacter sp. DWR2-3-1b2]|uniref:hypothetical protein n=1 Tax=unclassified Caulobacter TaxID=2648921 RepID=UPI003CEE494B
MAKKLPTYFRALLAVAAPMILQCGATMPKPARFVTVTFSRDVARAKRQRHWRHAFAFAIVQCEKAETTLS